MGDSLHAGSEVFTSQAEDTMAAAIERHISELLATPLAGADTPEARDRRRLFAGIARGVIEHLVDHPEALRVVFTEVPPNHTAGEFAAHVEIDASDVP